MNYEELIKYLLNMEEKVIVLVLTVFMYVVGLISYIALLYIPAIYGRYSSTGVPAKLAWCVQELPALLIPLLVLVATQLGWIGPEYDRWQVIVMVCFIFHYFQRSCIYPFLMIGGKPTPFYIMCLALLFCTVNGYIQVRGAVLFSTYPHTGFTVLRLVVGLTLFWLGLAINMHSDHVLRNLRKPGETGYKIPQGGFFHYVSCANFFGEIVEWFGFAIASWSIVAFAFAFFTAANLVPRAFSHHQWYLEKFEDYPKRRRAVIPYVL